MLHKTDDPLSGISASCSEAFSIKTLHEQYQNQPEPLRRQRRAYVIQLLRAEAQRRPTQHSCLWRYAGAVYGIDVSEVM